MPIGDPLDFTPHYTLNTLQTSNDTANLVINSLLIVLILTNITSTVSKLIYFTRGTALNYNTWLRGFIFANSDNPVRILSWVSRKYMYRHPLWTRYPNKLRLRRLILPLLARSLILIASIVAIAIPVPRETVLDGCARGDYKMEFVKDGADPNGTANSICTEIPLESRLGATNAVSWYCSCFVSSLTNFEHADSHKAAVAIRSSDRSFLNFDIRAGNIGLSILFYVEWTRKDQPSKFYRSDLGQYITEKALFEIVFAWFRADNQDCELIETQKRNDTRIGVVYCPTSIDVESSLLRIVSRLRSSVRWIRTDVPQTRLGYDIFLTAENTELVTEDCGVPVVANIPFVNMVPLTIVLVLLVAINAIISIIVSRHGNAVDAGFHVVKEALGHDTSSNPLEQCTERSEVMELKLQKWMCGRGGAHVGFIGRAGDVAVDRFDESSVVCGCGIAGSELERSRALRTASAGIIDSNTRRCL